MNRHEIVEQALTLPLEQREEFLQRACEGDSDLRAAVDELMADHEADRTSLNIHPGQDSNSSSSDSETGLHKTPADFDQPTQDSAHAKHVLDQTATHRLEAEPGTVLSERYVLQKKVGEGGMGEVWIAQQSEPVKRKVAVKLIKKGMDSNAVLARFEQERQALAIMDHPNIARVHDGGVTPTGEPFFVMELVRGSPLNKYCDKTKLTPRERLELFVPICQAVQHAHQKGIVHRDIKPANILVSTVDGKPVPKVIDFGVAKATGGKLTDETLATQFGAIVGTLEYMSPEQAGFSDVDVDTRADIYSLGVVLYELLTGLRPLDSNRLTKAAFTEMVRIIRDEEPSKPSTRLSTNDALPSLAATRQTEPRRLLALLRGELDWVVMKCLEKERDRRYETANGLARDIQRYLSGEPVEARPPSIQYRVGKFLRRNKGPVLAIGLLAATLVAGLVGTFWGMMEARIQRDTAKTAQAKTELALASARKQTQFALQANNDMVFSIQDRLANRPGMQDLRKELLERARDGLKRIIEDARQQGTPDHTLFSSHFRLGHLEWNLGNTEAAKKEYLAAYEMTKQFAEAHPNDKQAQHDWGKANTNMGDVTRQLGDTAAALPYYQTSADIDSALVAQDPDDVDAQQSFCVVTNKLGDIFLRLGRTKESLTQYQKVLKIRQRLVDEQPDDQERKRQLTKSLHRLGDVKTQLGELKEALDQYEQALSVSRILAEASPKNIELQNEFGENHKRVGLSKLKLDDAEGALAHYESATEILQTLVDSDPKNATFKRNLAGTFDRLGDVLLHKMNDSKSAVNIYEKGLKIVQELAKADPGNAEMQRDLSINVEKIGDVKMYLGQASESVPFYRQALDISLKLAEVDPQNNQAQGDVAFGYVKLGEAAQLAGDNTTALDYFDKSLKIREAIAEDDPDNAFAQQDLGSTFLRIGLVHLEEQNFSDCERWLKKFIDLVGKLPDPSTQTERLEHAEKMLLISQTAPKAIEDLDFALAQDPALTSELMLIRVKALLKTNPKAAVSSAERLGKWAQNAKADRGSHFVSAAAAFALCAGKIESERKDHLESCLKYLGKAKVADHFTPESVSSLLSDKHFIDVRNDPKLKEFIAQLQSN